REHRVRHAVPARSLAHVHPLDLREVVEQRNTAAAHRDAVEARHEEANVRLKERLEPKPMALLGRILGRQDFLELGNQRAHLAGRARRELDGDPRLLAHGRAPYYARASSTAPGHESGEPAIETQPAVRSELAHAEACASQAL